MTSGSDIRTSHHPMTFRSTGKVDVTFPASGTLASTAVAFASTTAISTSSTLTSTAATGGGVGYSGSAGGAVTQLTSKATTVILNTPSGQITTFADALAGAAEISFTWTNSNIVATDVIIVNMQSGGTAGAYLFSISAVGTGSCVITISNASAGSLSEALVLNVMVLKGVNGS